MLPHVLSKDNAQFVELLDAVAAAESLTFVVGAGASRDSGLPAWKALVRTFLEDGFRAALKQQLISTERSYEQLADDVLTTQDVISAATIGRYLHGEQRDVHLASALYEGHGTRPRIGRIGQAIALLAASRPGVRILTTNYDDLLERELADRHEVPVTVKSLSETQPLQVVSDGGPDAVEVIHLHGYAPYGSAPVGPLVLDEEDYALSHARPPGELLPALLGDGVTIFVGLSMTDPDLVAACHTRVSEAAGQALRWYGLFVGDAGEVAPATARYMYTRLEGMGLKPIHLASYGQISQILFEAFLRQTEDEYWNDQTERRYGRRLIAWRRALDAKHPAPQGGDAFQAGQADLHEQLASLAGELKAKFSGGPGDEHVAVHLWTRQPGPRLGSLELWGSSAHHHREAWTLRVREREINAGSGIPAVDAIFEASVKPRNAAPDGSRWQAVLAVPIELIDQPHSLLLVGALTLSSTVRMSQSGMRDRKPQLIERMQEWGRAWLTP